MSASIKYESQLREPLVSGDKNYHQVTEDICAPIEGKPSILWYVGFYIAVALLLFGIYWRLSGGNVWHRTVEFEPDCWLGLGHYQLCVVGRHWSCRHFDFCYSFIVPPRLAHRRKPGCRSHDHFCRNVRRSVSHLAHGARVDGVFCNALSKYQRTRLAELRFAPDVGCVCHLYLFYRIAPFLVQRSVARLCHGARQS